MRTINTNLITETSEWKCTNGLDNRIQKGTKQNKKQKLNEKNAKMTEKKCASCIRKNKGIKRGSNSTFFPNKPGA